MLKRIFVCWVMLFCLLAVSASAKEEGLVLYMKFDDLDGDEINDYSGMGNHGIAFGEYELVDGKMGKGLRMDGSTSNYVEVLDADTL